MDKRLNFSVYNVALAIHYAGIHFRVGGGGGGGEGEDREREYSPSMRPWIFSQFSVL